MKITCQSCQAKYTIADEKVVGKTVKIKCKKCGASIVVHGNEGGSAAAEPSAAGMPLGAESSMEGEPHIPGHGGGASGNPNEEWTVNVTDDDQRTMTTAQILVEYQRGVLSDDSYIWKDGMADWLPLSSVPEVMSLVASAGPRVPPAATSDPYAAQMELAAAQGDPQLGLGGTLMMENSSGPTAGAGLPPNVMSPGGGAAARRAQNRGGGAVDLFASAPERQLSDPSLAPPGPPGERAVGARNENSVLFSLSALNAAHGVPQRPQNRGEEAVLDLRPAAPAGPSRNNGRAGFDDIMNLGGGMSAGPILAPPPLLAPVMEAPPPQMAPVAAMAAPGMPGAPLLMPDMQQKKKSSAGLILGVVAGVVVLGGVGLFFAFREPSPSPTTEETTIASAAPSSAPSAVPTQTAAPTAPPPETTQATQATAPSGSPALPSTFGKPGGVFTGTRPGTKPTEKVEEKPPEKPPEKPAEKPPEAPAAGGGKDFDRAAASAALSRASSAARGCKKPDGPTGSGKVRVTFAPSGNVTSATVEGPPFAGTPVGGCIASTFRGARVPPFEGAPVSVTKTVPIN